MSAEMEAIVLDNGSGVIKAGFSGEDTPRAAFSACVGRVKNPEWFAAQVPSAAGGPAAASELLHERDTFVGAACQQYRDFLDVTHPIDRGVVEDWDALERIWEYVFAHELRIDPETCALPILCTSSPSGSKKQQERMAQILFESQRACGFYYMHQSVLSLLSSGRTRGIVVEIGHGSSHATPVFEGYALPHACVPFNTGGLDISNRLHKLLAKRGHAFHAFQLHTISAIKESTCAVAPKTRSLSISGNNHNALGEEEVTGKAFELPDGTVLQLDRQTQTSPAEVLFRPQELSDDHPLKPTKGLHECVASAIAMCDRDLQNDLFGAVVLAGGTTMLPGFCRRFQQELQAATASKRSGATLKVVPDPDVRERGYNSHRRLAAWIGGSMFASLPTFKDIHVSKQEWEEYHEAILDRKCF